MTPRTQTWLDHTGLNLIRIVIGSYFFAISMGLISGFDPTALFVPYLNPLTADLIGTMVLFSLTVIYMTGYQLRLSCLALALFVLSSSLAQNILFLGNGTISDFWRDLTMVCAVLLSYSSLRRAELRKAALVGRHRISGPRRFGQNIVPRRVKIDGTASRTMRPAQDIPMLMAAPSDMPRPDMEMSEGAADEVFDFKTVQFESKRSTAKSDEPEQAPLHLNFVSDDEMDQDDPQKNLFARL